MTDSALVVFTYRSKPMLLAERGSQAWALNPSNARRCTYLVCTRNRYSAYTSPEEQAAAREEHGAAFMVCKISTVEPSPERPERYIVRFDEYALLNEPDFWSKARNPVWYVDDIASEGIDPTKLDWLALPDESDADDLETDANFEKFAAPLGNVLLEFNNLELDVGKLIARLLRQDDVTAEVFARTISFREKLRLIKMLGVTKIQDPAMRREFDAFVKDATTLNAERNRYVNPEYIPVVDPNDKLVKLLHRRLKDGAKSAHGSASRVIQDLLRPVNEKSLRSLAADIHRLALRTRSLGEEHY